MARKDTLRVAISRSLQESIGLPGQTDEVDYFTLFKLDPDTISETAVDTALLERTKTLREWQSSPQYGPEVIGLLRSLQRVAKILKDSKRRNAYRKELSRAQSGKVASAIEEFTELVRAALGDGSITGKARSELSLYAQSKGLSAADSQQIIARVREELRAQRAAEPEPVRDEKWEFTLAEQGEEAFFLMLQSIETSGKFNEETPAHMLNQAGKYGIPVERAGSILQDFQRLRYRRMVERVAAGGAISDGQSRMLLAKASAYGLTSKQAYEQIADFTLSAYDTDEMLKNLKLQETFSADEIKEIVGTKASHIDRRKRLIDESVVTMLRNLAMIVVIGAAIIGAGIYFKGRQGGDGDRELAITPPAQADNGLNPPAAPTATPAENAPGTVNVNTPLTSLPDPPSGRILFAPEMPDDPPAFELAIAETPCVQYQAYLRATLEQAPDGWGADYAYPTGWAYRPVVNITADMADNFCQWLAREWQLPPGSVRLPNRKEFARAARGRTLRGDPSSPGFWAKAQLGEATESGGIRVNRWDKIFVPQKGQIYDLIGNVAEWGSEDQAGHRLVLGGDFQQKAPDFNPMQARWEAPLTKRPTIGFRVLVVAPNAG